MLSRILLVSLGGLMVVFSGPLGTLMSRWQKMIFGREFGRWSNRVVFIIVGILTMVMGFITNS